MAQAPAKFDMTDTVPIHPQGPGGQAPAKFDMSDAVPISASFAPEENNTEGMYQMVGKDGKPLHVPYSKVLDAGKAGYQITPDDFKRFTDDYGYANVKDKSIRARIDNALAPEDESTWAARGLNVVKGTTSGFVSPFLHPIKAVLGMGNAAVAFGGGPGMGIPSIGPTGNTERDMGNIQNRETQIRQQEQQGKEDAKTPFYTTASIVGPAVVTEGLSRVLPKAPGVKGLKAAAGERVRGLIGEEPAQDLVNKTLETNEKNISDAEKINAAHAEKHINDTLDAVQQTRETEDIFNRNEELRQEKLDKINDINRKKFDEQELARVKKEGDARLKVLEANKEKMANYDAEVNVIKAENERQVRLEIKRQNDQAEMTSLSKELKQKYVNAAKKATTDYNNTWNKWRNQVKDAEADMAPTVDTIKAQEASMNPQQVSVFRDILRESSPNDETMSGIEQREKLAQVSFGRSYEALSDIEKKALDQDVAQRGLDLTDQGLTKVPASRVHGWKSQLERAVRSTQDGTIRYAIGKVLDQLRTTEETVSQTVGPKAASQLAKARSITGPYFDTFFNKNLKEIPPVAEQSFREQVPEFSKAEAKNSRLNRISGYNSSIKPLTIKIAKLRQSLAEIKTQQKSAQSIHDPPSLKTVPAPPSPPGQFAERPFEPKPEPARVAPPDRPVTVEPEITKAGIDELMKMKEEAIRKGAKWVRYRGRWIATAAILGSGTIFNFLHAHLAAAAYDVIAGATAIYATGKIADYLERPEVTEWLARPTPRDLQILRKLPPEQLGELGKAWKPIIEEAEAKGKTVAPPIAKLFGATASASLPRKNKATPKELLEQAQKNLTSGFQQQGFSR